MLGSPIVYRDFFFGYEHPTAQSKALFRSDAGYWNGFNNKEAADTNFDLDITSKLDGPGKYLLIIQPDYGTNAGINVMSATFYHNNTEISKDEHPFNFEGGDTFYHLEIPNFDANGKYAARLHVVNGNDMNLHVILVKTEDDILNFFVRREDELDPGRTISASSVVGVAPDVYGVVRNAAQLKDELKDFSREEREAQLARVAAKFDLDNDRTEALIEAGLELASSFKDFIDVVHPAGDEPQAPTP